MEQITIFDALEDLKRMPVDDWWQYSSDNEVIYHAVKYCGEDTLGNKTFWVESKERLEHGADRFNFTETHKVLNWIEAEDEKRNDMPLDYMEMRDLALHGKNLRRYIHERGIKPNCYANRTEAYIIKDMYGQAKEDAIFEEIERMAYFHKTPKEKHDSGELTEEWLRRWYGIGGHSGPDCADIMHDYKGIQFSWSRIESGGIYPFHIGWGEMAKYFNMYFEEAR